MSGSMRRRSHWVPGVYREFRRASDAEDIAREVIDAALYRGRVALLIFCDRRYTIASPDTHSCEDMIRKAPEALVGVYTASATFRAVIEDVRERQQTITEEMRE